MPEWISFLRELEFPNLIRPFYRKTSDETDINNCAAWAAGFDDRWMQPPVEPWHFWPAGAPDEFSAEAFLKAYEKLGFQVCHDSSAEQGFDKLAVYAVTNGEFGHAAKLMPDGQWSSKLGDWEDISHTTTDLVENSKYGTVKYFMKRPI